MNDTPKVSIILPVYNGECYVNKVIESILNQQYTDLELIIVNNCSTDNTLNIIEKFATLDDRIKIIQNKNVKNMAENWNSWLLYGEGTYICMIHADDYYHENFVSESIKCIESNNSDYIISNANLVDEQERVFHILKYNERNFNKRLTYEKFPGIQRQFWKREKIKVKFKNQYFPIFDYVWYIENSKDSIVSYLNQNLVFIRVHSEQVTNKVDWIYGIFKTILLISINKVDLNKSYKKTIFKHLFKSLIGHIKLRIKLILKVSND